MNALLLRGIGAGLISATLFLAAANGGLLGVLLFYIAPLPLFLAGLSTGYIAALIGTLSGGAMLGALSGINGGLMFAAMCGIAPIILCRWGLLSREFERETGTPSVEWYPVGYLVCWVSGLACVAVILAALVMMGNDGGLYGWIQNFLSEAFRDQLVQMLQQVESPLSADDAIAAMARNVPFVMGLIWILTALLNGVLAQAILVKSGQSIRPKTSYSNWFLPRELNLGLAIALTGALFDGTIGLIGFSIGMLLLLPYFLLGLAVIHVISRRFQGREFMLASLYLVLLLLMWPALLIILVGLTEQWTDLRNRWATPSGPNA